MIFFYLFLSTLNSALASFFLLALVFIDIQNSTANSSTNFLFIKVGNLRKINNNMKFSHKIDKNLFSILINVEFYLMMNSSRRADAPDSAPRPLPSSSRSTPTSSSTDASSVSLIICSSTFASSTERERERE